MGPTALLALTLVLHNVTVIDGTGAPPRVADVVVQGEKIARVGACAHPKGARVIDGTGKYVMPGLIDMHVHLLLHPWDEQGEIEKRWDRGAIEEMLRLLLANGVTTIRDPGSETEAAVTFRELLARGKLEGPRLVTAGRIVNASRFDSEPFQPSLTADDIRKEIRYQAAAGVDLIKIYSSTSPELAKVAVDEAHAHKLPIVGHLGRTSWSEAARLGIDGVEHAAPWSPDLLPEEAKCDGSLFGRVCWLEQLDLASPKVRELARLLAEKQVVVDPTLIAMHTKFWGDDPRYTRHAELARMPAKFRAGWPAGRFTSGWTAGQYAQGQRAWPKLLAFTKLLYDAGVPLVAGTDTPTPWIIPGVSLHEELQLLRDAGIPNGAIVRIATSNAARALRRPDLGVIAAGKTADLLLLSRNPLEDIAHTRAIELVLQRGKVKWDQ